MKKTLSLTAAWNEASAFARRDFGQLFLIAFGLISLPAVILQSAMPATEPGVAPEVGAWALLIGPVLLLSILGTLTLTNLALGRSPDPRDAFAQALARLPAVLGAALLFGLGAALAAIPLIIVFALMVPSPQAAAAILVPFMLVYFLCLWVRLLLINPVGAAERGGPVAILKRSWGLIKGHFWTLLGLTLALLVLFMVLAGAVGAAGGAIILLLTGPAEPGSLGSVAILLLGGVLNGVVGVFFAALVARIYAQLTALPSRGI